MPSKLHDVSAELFRWSPEITAELLTGMGVDLPEVSAAEDVSESFTDHKTSEYTGDVALVLDTDDGPRGVVVEVQRGDPQEKRWTWPLYHATLRARRRCPVMLLVIAPDEAIADKCARPIETGHPGNVLTPLVLRPEHVPILDDADQIIADPAMAVLSALFHGGGPGRDGIVKAAFDATNKLAADGDPMTRRYYDYVMAVLPEVARTSLEEKMKTESPHYYSDVMRNAQAEGEAKAVLRILERREIAITEEQRTQIAECTDLERLGAWLDRALDATSAEDFFGN